MAVEKLIGMIGTSNLGSQNLDALPTQPVANNMRWDKTADDFILLSNPDTIRDDTGIAQNNYITKLGNDLISAGYASVGFVGRSRGGWRTTNFINSRSTPITDYAEGYNSAVQRMLDAKTSNGTDLHGLIIDIPNDVDDTDWPALGVSGYVSNINTIISNIKSDLSQSDIPVFLVCGWFYDTLCEYRAEMVQACNELHDPSKNIYVSIYVHTLTKPFRNNHMDSIGLDRCGEVLANTIDSIWSDSGTYRGPQLTTMTKQSNTEFLLTFATDGTSLTPNGFDGLIMGYRLPNQTEIHRVRITDIAISGVTATVTIATPFIGGPAKLIPVMHCDSISYNTNFLKYDNSLGLPVEPVAWDVALAQASLNGSDWE